MQAAAIGFRAKTGHAIAVALCGAVDEPALVWRRDVSLVDPAVPETSQPYHAVMDLPWPQALAAAERFVSAIEVVAADLLGTLVRELRSNGFAVRGIGVVGSPDRKLEKIGNPHIRAHGAEGVLFRRVLEKAAETNGIASRAFTEKDVAQCAMAELHVSRARLLSQLKRLGVEAGPPWRGEEKAAATAALLCLRNSAGSSARPDRRSRRTTRPKEAF
ncbi:MAG TPA: hypothetical protein VF980_06235 [Thermoanaerobaculia bacterium]